MKKIRGVRRHSRWLRKRSQTPAGLSLSRLQSWHYDYVKLGLGPWQWQHQQPPQWVRQRAAEYLLSTFFHWQTALAKQTEPFYLAVWLVSSAFAHSSQVVAGWQERIERYEGIFGEAVTDGPALLAEYQQLPGADELTWRTFAWEELLDAQDYPEGWPVKMLQRPHRTHQTSEGEEYLLVQTGWVWVGTMS